MKTPNKTMLITFFLLSITIFFISIKPALAKFQDEYITENEVVGLNLSFNLSLSNIEEYEEVKVEANSYEIRNINVFNSTNKEIYYGIWYKLVTPKQINDNIKIARLIDNETSMTSSLGPLKDKTATIIIKNNTENDIIVNIGVSSSEKSEQDIEYLNDKYLINEIEQEVDYYYSDSTKKYFSKTTGTYFEGQEEAYKPKEEEQIYIANHDGSYLIETWGANQGEEEGLYAKGIITLKENEELYLYPGIYNTKNSETEVCLGIRQEKSENCIMIINTKKENSYLSGHYGMTAPLQKTEEEEKECKEKYNISCSYHISNKIFKKTKIEDTESKKVNPNDKNGYIKITPIIPTMKEEVIKLKTGEQLNKDTLHCETLSGACNITRFTPEDTTNLSNGTHDITFMLTDENGYVYQYTKKIEITE